MGEDIGIPTARKGRPAQGQVIHPTKVGRRSPKLGMDRSCRGWAAKQASPQGCEMIQMLKREGGVGGGMEDASRWQGNSVGWGRC